MKRLLLINGPPRCGKDEIVKGLASYITFGHEKISQPLKDTMCSLLGVTHRELEEIKDIPHRVLNDKTPRQGQISESEDWLKKQYGDDVLGRSFFYRAKRRHEDIVIVSDSGFNIEAQAIVERAGKGAVVGIRIHRPGYDFRNDSREYLSDGVCKLYDIHNTLTTHDLTMRVLSVILREWREYVTLLREPNWIKD